MPDIDRETGWYWVTGLGDEPEVARWDQEGGVWHVVGGNEGMRPRGITVLGNRLVPPIGAPRG